MISGEYFYVGYSTNPELRLKSHKTTYGHKIKMIIIQKMLTTKENAAKMERYWINQLSFYGSDLHNVSNHTTRKNKKPIIKPPKEVKKYQKRLEWVYLTDEQKKDLFFKLPRGSYTKIAKSIGCNAETIRRLFQIKPNKVLQKHYYAIVKLKEDLWNVKEPQ